MRLAVVMITKKFKLDVRLLNFMWITIWAEPQHLGLSLSCLMKRPALSDVSAVANLLELHDVWHSWTHPR